MINENLDILNTEEFIVIQVLNQGFKINVYKNWNALFKLFQ